MPFNPYQLASCIISILVFIVILCRPQWLGNSKQLAFIVGVTVIGSVYLLFTQENWDQFNYTALSLMVSLVGGVFAYLERRQPIRAFKIICISFILIVWLQHTYNLFGKTDTTYDERFYLSIAATANGGHGLYPALQDYPPMPIMGGIGHLAWLYVLAYQIWGPSLYSLRLMVLLFSLLSLPAIFLLFRRWYGAVTAWLAVALLPSTLLYVATLTARMDAFTMTCLWWAVLLVDIAREKKTWRWHFGAGLWIGLCLQAHVHTSIMAIAFGILYLIDYGRLLRQTGRWVLPRAVVVYSTGALFGLGIYIVANILPDPDAFFRTAGNVARFSAVSKDLDVSLIDRLVTSFTSFRIFFANFIERVFYLLHSIHPVELSFWVMAFLSLFWRRSHGEAARTTIILSVMALLVGFFILNNGSLFYTTHIGLPLLLCVPPFFTYGFRRTNSMVWKDITPGLVLVLSTCVFPVYMTTSLPSILLSPRTESSQETVALMKKHISTQCRIIGPDDLFIFELPIYSLYFSGEDIAANLGLRYYDYKSDVQLWQALDPDIAIMADTLAESLNPWLLEMKYEEIFPSIWQKTQSPLSSNCVIYP